MVVLSSRWVGSLQSPSPPAGLHALPRPRGGARGSSPAWERRTAPHPLLPVAGPPTINTKHNCAHFPEGGIELQTEGAGPGGQRGAIQTPGVPLGAPRGGVLAGSAGSHVHCAPRLRAGVGPSEFPRRGCTQEGIRTSRSLPRRRAGSCGPHPDQPLGAPRKRLNTQTLAALARSCREDLASGRVLDLQPGP